jgi:hypothetical protein
MPTGACDGYDSPFRAGTTQQGLLCVVGIESNALMGKVAIIASVRGLSGGNHRAPASCFSEQFYQPVGSGLGGIAL